MIASLAALSTDVPTLLAAEAHVHPMSRIIVASTIIFAIAIAAVVVRLIKGPSLPDRVVALDLLGFQVISLVGLAAITSGRKELLGVALVAAIILFLGTAAFAMFLQRRGHE